MDTIEQRQKTNNKLLKSLMSVLVSYLLLVLRYARVIIMKQEFVKYLRLLIPCHFLDQLREVHDTYLVTNQDVNKKVNILFY